MNEEITNKLDVSVSHLIVITSDPSVEPSPLVAPHSNSLHSDHFENSLQANTRPGGME